MSELTTEQKLRAALQELSDWPASYPANANIQRMRDFSRAVLALPESVGRVKVRIKYETDDRNGKQRTVKIGCPSIESAVFSVQEWLPSQRRRNVRIEQNTHHESGWVPYQPPQEGK